MVDNLNATFDEGWLDQSAPAAKVAPVVVEEAPVEEAPKDEKKK
jgi:hypothetical protein